VENDDERWRGICQPRSGALGDHSDVDVAAIDFPAFLAVVERSSAGEGGHAVIKSARLPNGKFDSKISFSK
jgi:hypothetical protein